MRYREPLPEGCPPDAAEEIVSSRETYRLVRTNPPTEVDFLSQRAENPVGKLPDGIDECRARGLSVFGERHDAEKALKLPRLSGRAVCRLRLGAGAGQIQKTGGRSHHTWWPLADYDILAGCELETA